MVSIYRCLARWCVPALVVVFSSHAVSKETTIREQYVQFKAGSSSATVTGRIRGYDTVDYVFKARKGQFANISLASRHTATYFNLLAPGQNEVAFFNGSFGENQFEGSLPEDGEYRARVYMMRSAARRNEVANYRLEVLMAAQSADTPPSGAGGDAKVPGTNYHATGNIPCALAPRQGMLFCPFGVLREGGGNGKVTITRPDGRKRTIVFQSGEASGYEMSPGDDLPMRSTRNADTTTVQIGEERYEIPDAIIQGG